MKMISILAATVFLAGSATVGFAATSYAMEHAGDMGANTVYTQSQLTTGRSVSEMRMPMDNCQKGEPSVSPNGIATLSDMAVCR